MAHHTERSAAPHQRYESLIDEAEHATGILPTIDDCRRLTDGLRDAIRDLADQVRRKQDRLPADGIDWSICEQALLGAQGALCGDLGLGLRSAALHVATLGAAARRLVECIGRD
ncbi:DUF6415 family natural product biosynthesis protein [Streptomyces sp. NPDC006872]|uniref:DUF6415 family natural product biosynthesis protein n=1 Tax=Streptomyces sp. NPDC006872 TaxID=3155720 RepID=UPI0033D774F9